MQNKNLQNLLKKVNEERKLLKKNEKELFILNNKLSNDLKGGGACGGNRCNVLTQRDI